MNNKINCEVVKDLLPLYADEICSESSRELVKEHIADCENCRQELEDYRYNTGLPEIDEKEAIKKFSKKIKNSNLKKIVISVVLCLCVILGSAWALFVPEFIVPYSDGLLEAKIPTDGGIDVWVNLDNYKNIDFWAEYKENDEIDVYLTVRQNVFTKIVKDSDTSDNFWRTNGFICMSMQDGKTDFIHPDNTVKNIYYLAMDIDEAKNISGDDNKENDSIFTSASHLIWSAPKEK